MRLPVLSPILTLSLALSFAGCTYTGPHVDTLVPLDQDAWLSGEVESPGLGRISHLVVYGDSLSDNGNLNRNSFGFVVPQEVFYRGNFSNGPVWAEYVQNALHWTLDDYAVGGAETGPGFFTERYVVTPFPAQIEKSEKRLAELDPDKTLVAIWIGPNNYLRHGAEYQNKKGEPDNSRLNTEIKRSIGDIRRGLETIIKLGFHHIVLGTMPELGGINRSPEDTPRASDATLFLATRLHNEALHALIKTMKTAEPGIQLITYDAYAINKKTYEHPADYAFTRLDLPCFEGSITGKFFGPQKFCTDPMGYKFWEYLHPNTRMHCFYAAQFLGDIAESKVIGGYDKAKAIARCKAIQNRS